MKKATRDWVRKAEDDHRLVGEIARRRLALHNQLCFRSQQAAEKYLKALLEELGLAVAKTHELVQLFNTLLPHHPPLRPLRRGLKFPSNVAVAVRYPGDNATKRQAIAAGRWVGKVRDACRAILAIRAPRRRRRRP
jgi:HEPN domain-containing protein